MAWYRAGGGGIPSSLKTGMNSVLNKKFGTSTTYDPAGWPDDVNLLGKLPEKTVSGAIAHITDGADEVPIKSWEVEIAPTLTGKSAIEATQSGANIANFDGHTEATYSDLTITANADGSISISGTPSRSWAHLTTDFAVDLPVGTYTLSRGASATYAMYIAVKYEDNTTQNISMALNASTTFTTTKKIIQIRLDIATLSTSTNYDETVSVMLEVGSTPSTFEKYTAPTVSTVNLGRTIYGGTADVVNGTGTDENGNDFTFTPITPTPETALGVNNFWADSGDTEVTYRADIDLALGGN